MVESEGKFKPLHKFNPIRISYIKDNIIDSFKLTNKDKPLNTQILISAVEVDYYLNQCVD